MAAIVPNSFTRQNTEYFLGFTSYNTPPDGEATDRIQQMVSYSLNPLRIPTEIDQVFGARDVYSFEVMVKNMTKNVILEVRFDHDKYWSVDPGFIDLGPDETKKVTISVNNSAINENGNPVNFISTVLMKIRNVQNGTVAYRNINTNPLEQSNLPENVEIL